MYIAEAFADFSVNLELDRLPVGVVREAKLLFMDWLASAFCGAEEESTKSALRMADALKGREESTVIPLLGRNSCIMASLVNGISSHAVEMDDVHRQGIIHPGNPVFSAILPLAEKYRVSGRGFLEAAVAGYEIGIRSAVAAGPGHYRYWHTTGTCGTFGAAAGAAKLLSLDRRRTCWAIGTAGSQASGLWEFIADNAMSKQLHPAKAAVNGILAALLAKEGFTGTASIYEGEKGFFRATSPDFDPGAATRHLGEGRYKISECSIKRHASCGHTHSAIDGVLDLMKRHSLSSCNIARIDIHLYDQAVELLENIIASTPFSSKFNMPFCIASAAFHGEVGLEAFTAERIQSPALREFMGCIYLHRDARLTRKFPEKFPARVLITTKDGKVLEVEIENPKGTPENPLSMEEIMAKCMEMMSPRIGRFSEKLLDRAMKLEKLESLDDFFA